MSTPGRTDISARAPAKKSPGDIQSAVGFEIIPDRDVYVSWGPAPDPTQLSGVEDKARILVRARELRSVFCNVGDFVAWTPA